MGAMQLAVAGENGESLEDLREVKKGQSIVN